MKSALLLFAAVTLTAQGQEAPAQKVNSGRSDRELKLVVILSRHGVRPPTGPLNYAKQPWPVVPTDWGAAYGDLTPRGFQLLKLLGAWYRDVYVTAGILPADVCPQKQIFIYADEVERTVLTAQAYGQGFVSGLPGCALPVYCLQSPPASTSSSTNGVLAPNCSNTSSPPIDPLFHPLGSKDFSPPNSAVLQRAANALLRMAPKLERDYHTALEDMQTTLECCAANECPVTSLTPPPPKCTLLRLPNKTEVGSGDDAVKWSGPFDVASTAAETFLLEYANGMPCHLDGWGRVDYHGPDCHDAGGRPFRKMEELHTLEFEMIQRQRYAARIQGSNLASHILQAMQMKISGQRGTPESDASLILLAGHDTNVANVGGLLGLSWELPDLPKNDTPPGGALVFELSKRRNSADYSVRISYIHQTLDQLRTGEELSLEKPPSVVRLSLPGCPASEDGCPFSKFQKYVKKVVDPQFILPYNELQAPSSGSSPGLAREEF